MPSLSNEMNTGDTLQTLLDQVDRLLAGERIPELEPASLNCQEVMRGCGSDVVTCQIGTLLTCAGENCEMAICESHAIRCGNCGDVFCWPDYQNHWC